MDLDQALGAVPDNHQAVLTTIPQRRAPQLSNVLQALGDDGVVRVSTTADRAKYANLRRTPWAALHVDGGELLELCRGRGRRDALRGRGRPARRDGRRARGALPGVLGEHDDWEDYRAAMVRDRRVVVRLTPTRAYGALR